jgi:hypothetical protein
VSVEPSADVRSRALCAAVSSAAEEPLAATASRIDHWLVLEYRALWDRDVLGASRLSQGLKEHLREQLHLLGPSRLLFVKRPERRGRARRQVFFGRSRPGNERFYRLEVDHLEDLEGFDFAAALAADEPAGVPLDHPLLVVCTHGKRDRCCAKYGGPAYVSLCGAAPSDWIWQSTHVGGDRFAGNVVVLPHGLYYGRVGEADAERLLAATREGRVELDRYRGRCSHSFPVQAAEIAIREAEGLLGIGDLAFAGADPHDEGAWRVRFRGPDGALREVDVEARDAEEPTYLTCCSARPQRARAYVATGLRTLRGS